MLITRYFFYNQTKIKNSNNFYKIQKRNMLSSATKSSSRHPHSFSLITESFLNFRNHSMLCIQQCHSKGFSYDILIYRYISKIQEKDYFINRVSQLCLDVTYNKKNFNFSQCKDLFHDNLSFQSHLKPNIVVSDFDHSTLYTGVQATLVQNQHKNLDIVVKSTPPSRDIPKDINQLGPLLAKTINKSEELTGNRFSDISINEIPFDFKYTKVKDMELTSNHIYIYPNTIDTMLEIKQVVQKMLLSVNNRINQKLTNNKKMPETDKDIPITEFYWLQKKLTILKTNIESIPHDKIQDQVPILIHSFTNDFVNTMERRPNFGFPIIIVGKDKYQLPEIEISTPLDMVVPVPFGSITQKTVYDFLKESLQEDLNSKIKQYPSANLTHFTKFLDDTTE